MSSDEVRSSDLTYALDDTGVGGAFGQVDLAIGVPELGHRAASLASPSTPTGHDSRWRDKQRKCRLLAHDRGGTVRLGYSLQYPRPESNVLICARVGVLG